MTESDTDTAADHTGPVTIDTVIQPPGEWRDQWIVSIAAAGYLELMASHSDLN